LRILLVFETLYPDTLGGVEHRNCGLGQALARRGHQVTLAGFGGARAAGAGPQVLPLGRVGRIYTRRGRRRALHALRFAWAARKLSPRSFDVVEAANMHYLYLFPLAARCRRAGVPLLVTWYEYWAGYWSGYVGPWLAPLCRAVEWLAAQLGTKVAATSRLVAGRLARVCRGDPPELLPCGIDLSRIEGAAAAARPGPPLVYAGRLIAHKRVDLLLQALALLGDVRAGEPLLTVFGEGPEGERLVARAAELGIASRVGFRGFVPDSAQVWREMAGARVAVQPSVREGFGLFPLEAMALGLPVVYCRSPESAVPELVRDGIEGLACQAEPAALAATLRRLLADDLEHGRLARAARTRAAQFDWDSIAARFEELCASAEARRSRALSAAPRPAASRRRSAP
jgi:glycosyltransferase involved in cell wall biosynthesis